MTAAGARAASRSRLAFALVLALAPGLDGERTLAAAPAASSAAPAIAAAGASSPATAADRGSRLFLFQCRACHSATPDRGGKIGPSLHGVVGRRAASAPGFAYSPALAGSGLVWDEATLDAFLAAPARRVPGTAMIYAGLASPRDRQAIIEFLKSSPAAPSR